jgi:hypothetical protein
MKKTFILFILLTTPLFMNALSISSIERNGSWYYLYDENGKRCNTFSASSIGDVVGWSSSFFVAQNGSWIYLYDANGKRYKTLSKSSVGDVIAVSGNTFVAKNGSWIYTYDKDGRRISTRSAQ